MPIDDVPPSLQESILAALIFDERHAQLLPDSLPTNSLMKAIAKSRRRVLNYRRKYRKAPGRAHLDDLFGKLLQPGRAPRMRRLVFDLAELAEGINGEYLVSRTEEFIRQQRYKGGIS